MFGQGNHGCAYTRPTAVELNFASLNQTKLPKSLPILESPLIFQKLLRLMLNCLEGKIKFVNFIFWSVNSQFRLYIAANLQRRLKQQNCYSSINIMQIAVFFFNQHPKVLIIGGGVIGLTTAYLLLEKGSVWLLNLFIANGN